MRILNSKRYLLGCWLILALSSCTTLTPHENFKLSMEATVGSSIDNPNLSGAALPKYLLESKSLPNGNRENKYLDSGSCRYFFEYNPVTRIIVGWRFEGSENDCAIAP